MYWEIQNLFGKYTKGRGGRGQTGKKKKRFKLFGSAE